MKDDEVGRLDGERAEVWITKVAGESENLCSRELNSYASV